MKYYIRFGEIPLNEKSKKVAGGYENGVSVYDAVLMTDGWHVILPIPTTRGQGNTYEYLINSNRNIYLVIGDEIGKGSDNEPVIINIKILKDVTKDFRNICYI